jgi:RNA polymerase sigma-70 factor (ECF subfamily)
MAVSLHDPSDFTAAYRDLAPRALRAADAVLHDRAAAEDVVQDVFLELWQGRAGFDSARGSLPAYVAMLARSRALDRWRSRVSATTATARLGDHQWASGLALAEPPDDEVARRERVGQAVRALKTIPVEQREALLLAYAGGLSDPAVADAAGVPLGTAKGRIRMGLAKLRAQVAVG